MYKKILILNTNLVLLLLLLIMKPKGTIELIVNDECFISENGTPHFIPPNIFKLIYVIPNEVILKISKMCYDLDECWFEHNGTVMSMTHNVNMLCKNILNMGIVQIIITSEDDYNQRWEYVWKKQFDGTFGYTTSVIKEH